MDALAHLTAETKARRALLNDTFLALRELRPRVTLIIYDPVAMLRLRNAARLPRTLMHPLLPGFKK